MVGIQIGDAASIMTEITTIFNGDQDDRYVTLRSIRKEISVTVNNFLKTRKALMAMTLEEIEADVEIEGVQGDNDQSRLYVVLNTVEWVKTVHGCLDSYNQFDNAMLGKMADYVEKIGLLIGAEHFFSPPSEEVQRKAIFPTRDEIVLVRSESDIVKRAMTPSCHPWHCAASPKKG